VRSRAVPAHEPGIPLISWLRGARFGSAAHPKDFDIATDATPEECHTAVRNCRLIGRRFRLAHVLVRNEIVEVATPRSSETAAATATDRRPIVRATATAVNKKKKKK